MEFRESMNTYPEIVLPVRKRPKEEYKTYKLGDDRELRLGSGKVADYERLLQRDSALVLAKLAMEHHSASAEVSAHFLIALEEGKDFKLIDLNKFDAKNKGHAFTLLEIMSSHEHSPSCWMKQSGYDGKKIMRLLKQKWL